jgi:hypothetical protein
METNKHEESEQMKYIKTCEFFSGDEIKIEDGNVQINTTIKCEDTGQNEQIKIVFENSPEFDPTYESEQITFIKESGLMPEDEIKFEKGYMFFKDGGFSVDDPWQREFHYKHTYISNRDKKTKESLQDNQTIKFCNINHNSDDENEDDYENTHGLLYKEFLDNKIELKEPDELVLAQSYISVRFNSPVFRDHTTFTILANDEMKGFTRKELAIKCMKYFHLQYYLCQHYDMNEGCFKQDHGTGLFRPVLYYDEYTENGLSALEYYKEKDYWLFICMDYI